MNKIFISDRKRKAFINIFSVHLVGTYSGTVFEERDVKFSLGEGFEAGIVEGLEVALKKFKKGEKSKIYLSPKYAFGADGNSNLNIPSNSSVEYEVTLISFEKVCIKFNVLEYLKIIFF